MNNLKIFLAAIAATVAVLGASQLAEAHPGRTDRSGGHTCRTNCPRWGLSYGEYHYHGSTTPPSPPSPTFIIPPVIFSPMFLTEQETRELIRAFIRDFQSRNPSDKDIEGHLNAMRERKKLGTPYAGSEFIHDRCKEVATCKVK